MVYVGQTDKPIFRSRQDGHCFGCVVMKDWLVANRTAEIPGAELSENAGEVLREMSPPQSPLEVAPNLDQALQDAGIGIFRIRDGEDPDSKALVHRDEGAAPIYVMSWAPHWSWAPGEDAIRIVDDPLSPELLERMVEDLLDPGTTWWGDPARRVPGLPGVPKPGQVVVIDTPYIGPDESRIQPDGIHSKGEGPSHGTFIASLIRQMGVGVRMINPGVVRSQESLHYQRCGARAIPGAPEGEALNVPSELHVFNAVLRALASSEDFDRALNMSFGTYPCSDPSGQRPLKDPFVPRLVEAAVNRWNERGPDDAPVVAAAGNSLTNLPFYPAYLDGVVAVSGNWLGSQDKVLAWEEKPMQTRYETTPIAWPGEPVVSAPGLDLLAFGGYRSVQNDEGLVAYAWSGSSFATALVSASYAAGLDGVVDYSTPGLAFVDRQGQVVVN